MLWIASPSASRSDAAGRGRSPTTNPMSDFLLVRGDLRLVNGELHDVSLTRATALCALGQPDRFLSQLAGHVELVKPLVLPDHDPLTSGTLLERLPPDLPVVVTAKDWIKLRERPDVGTREFVIAMQDVQIAPEQQFREWLTEKLNESQTQSGSR